MKTNSFSWELSLGTPHRGSDYASWGEIARTIASALLMDTNTSLIRGLEVDSSELDLAREEFAKILRNSRLKIYSFQEGKALTGIKRINRKVCSTHCEQCKNRVPDR